MESKGGIIVNTLLDDICNLVILIANRDHKTWGQAIEEITESLNEENGGMLC